MKKVRCNRAECRFLDVQFAFRHGRELLGYFSRHFSAVTKPILAKSISTSLSVSLKRGELISI